MKYVVVVEYLDEEGVRKSVEIISLDSHDSITDAIDELKETVMAEIDATEFILLRWEDRTTLRVKMPNLEPPNRERVYRVQSVKTLASELGSY